MTTVVHWEDKVGRTGEDWVYIGRKGGGLFGNPFYGGTRAENIARFRLYFYESLERDEKFEAAVHALKGKQLVCHCKPLPCHGDVIAEYLNG